MIPSKIYPDPVALKVLVISTNVSKNITAFLLHSTVFKTCAFFLYYSAILLTEKSDFSIVLLDKRKRCSLAEMEGHHFSSFISGYTKGAAPECCLFL